MGVARLLGLFIGKHMLPRRQPHSQIAAAAPPVARFSCFHWPGNGRFRHSTVGESYYRDQIQAIALNGTHPALVFCTAHLVPEQDNAHDPLAVAIRVNGVKIAHLSREDARTFRGSLQDRGLTGQTTSCNAVIRGGGTPSEKGYDYCIELDLEDDGSTSPMFPELVRRSPAPQIVSRSSDELIVQMPFVDRGALSMCSLGCELSVWTTPSIADVHFFTPSSVGGTGRVCAIPKDFYAGFETDLEHFSFVSVLRLDGRSVFVRCGKSIDPQFAFSVADHARMVIFSTDKAGQFAALAVDFDPRHPVEGQPGETVSGSVCAPMQDCLDKLHRLVGSADFIVGHDVEEQVRCLADLCPEAKRKIWASTERTWFNDDQTPPEQIAAIFTTDRHLSASETCSALSNFLFTHSGKTKRSRTHMVRLLSSSSWS